MRALTKSNSTVDPFHYNSSVDPFQSNSSGGPFLNISELLLQKVCWQVGVCFLTAVVLGYSRQFKCLFFFSLIEIPWEELEWLGGVFLVAGVQIMLPTQL